MMRTASVIAWMARGLAIAMCAFLGVFALDAQSPGGFVMHLLPAGVVLGLVALSWRRPLIGGVGFLGLAVLYAVMVSSRPDWVLVISGPLLVIGLLYFWDWQVTRATSY